MASFLCKKLVFYFCAFAIVLFVESEIGLCKKPSNKWGKNMPERPKHDVFVVTKENFTSRVLQKRSQKVNALLLCGYSKQNCKDLLEGVWNNFTSEVRELANTGFVDCDKSGELCNTVRESVGGGDPSNIDIVVYPIQPFPAYSYKGEMTFSGFLKEVYRLLNLPDLKLVESSKLETFTTVNPSFPKVLVFAEKSTGPPEIFKGLAKAFDNKLSFGFVPSTETSIMNRYSVKTVPSVRLVRPDKKVEKYSGKMEFRALFEWLNIYSETVLSDTPEQRGSTNVKKPTKKWKYERIPEMTKDSYEHICFTKNKKGMCAIYLKEGSVLSPDETDMLETLKESHKTNLYGRATDIKWSWIDISKELDFKQMFDVDSYPSMIVIKQASQPRFVTLGKGMSGTESSIRGLMEKIFGGDAKFSNLPKVPEFAERPAEQEL